MTLDCREKGGGGGETGREGKLPYTFRDSWYRSARKHCNFILTSNYWTFSENCVFLIHSGLVS